MDILVAIAIGLIGTIGVFLLFAPELFTGYDFDHDREHDKHIGPVK